MISAFWFHLTSISSFRIGVVGLEAAGFGVPMAVTAPSSSSSVPSDAKALADERCSRAVLDFLSTTDVGRRVPAPAEEDTQSEVSEWELRERREREEESRAEDEELGAAVEEPLFLPTPAFMASAEEE
jgi:hypothetical protein